MVAGYFVTGATGVVGAAVVERLLAAERGPIHLLIRAEDERALAARTRGLREHWGDRDDAGPRLRVHRGDVTQPDLGLSNDAKRVVTRDVTRIIHAAGDVHMGRSLERARGVAVGGLERVLELGAELNALRRLEKIEVVSTVGVGGHGGTLPEKFVSRPASFHNTYEEAKWEAEAVAERQLARGLPLTVHRPSMVVGDSRTGLSVRGQIFRAICTFLTGAPTLGLLPALGGRHIDLVPQDFVARALVWSSTTLATAGRVLHLSSGRYDATPLLELAHVARSTARRLRLRSMRPIFVDARAMRIAISALARLRHDLRRRAALLHVLLDYLERPMLFLNEASQRLLRAAAVALPSPERYLGRVVAASLATSARCA